jgi:membrane associated rhomboid family serine protease
MESFTRGAPVASLLLAAMVLVSVAGLSFAPQIVRRSLFRPYWLARQQNPLIWISNGFVHASYAHLFFNALTFWSFGFGLERAIGSVRFAALYAAGLLVSDAGTYLKHRADPDYASLGASGAILAVLFAAIVYFPNTSMYIMFLPVPVPAPLFAGLYLAYTIDAARNKQDGINHDAHLGGAITGLLFVLLTDPRAVAAAWVSLTSR